MSDTNGEHSQTVAPALPSRESIQRTRERVARGVQFLDAHFGDHEWINRIDPTTLDMKDGSRCVLGQLIRIDDDPRPEDYLVVVRELGIFDERDQVHFGFEVDLIDGEQDYEVLRFAWLEVLSEQGW